MDEITQCMAVLGWVFWPLLLVGLATYALIGERLWTLFAPGWRRWQEERAVYERLAALERECQRRQLVLRSLIASAPLLGLLGTVSGMVVTFAALHSGKSDDVLALGIGRALLSTELGLAIALPALLIQALLMRRCERLIGDYSGRLARRQAQS